MRNKFRFLAAVLTASLLLSGCALYSGSQPSDSDSSHVSQTTSTVSENASSETSEVESSLFRQSSKQSESSSESVSKSVSESVSESSIADRSSAVSESSKPLQESSSSVSQKPQESQSSVQESSVPSKPQPPDPSKLYNYQYKYFVNKLPEDLLRNFVRLYEGASQFKSTVTFDKVISQDELTTMMFLLNYDCPELIHVSGDYYPHYVNDSNDVNSVGLSFCMTEKEYESARKELDQFFAQLKKKLAFNSDIEKEKYVYDYIFCNCIYDEYDLLSGSVYGTLIQQRGRCEGFSKSFMWCMNELGVECMTVAGLQYWNTTSLYSNHSWNIVKIRDNYYHLDVTVDNVQFSATKGNLPNYGFYNVSDDYIFENRNYESLYNTLGVPVCDTMIENYHTKNDLFIYYDDFYKINLFKILSDHLSDDKLEPVSIKFYNEADFLNACDSIDDDVSEFLRDNSDQLFDYQTSTNNLSRTIIIKADPVQQDSGEE